MKWVEYLQIIQTENEKHNKIIAALFLENDAYNANHAINQKHNYLKYLEETLIGMIKLSILEVILKFISTITTLSGFNKCFDTNLTSFKLSNSDCKLLHKKIFDDIFDSNKEFYTAARNQKYIFKEGSVTSSSESFSSVFIWNNNQFSFCFGEDK